MYSQKKKFYNMLAIITNGLKTKQFSVRIPNFRYCTQFLSLLKEDGFIYGYKINSSTVEVFLKYFEGRPLFSGLRGISSVRGKYFCKLHEIKVNGFYSTVCGILTGRQCLKKGLGGEFLAEIY